MLTLLEQLDKGTLWRSPGGIHLPEIKTLSNQNPIAALPLASRFVVPVPLVGQQATLCISVGDKVLKGQALTQGAGFTYLPVHSPTSGILVAIEQHHSNHPSSLPVLSCIIEADGLDTWCELIPGNIEQLSKQAILDKIKHAGIAGMGGAAFPSHIKLNPASEIDLVIINGVECEPYITSDDRLMREHSDDILTGISIIHHLLNPQRIIIAIEDNKPEAAQAMKAAIERSSLPNNSVRVTIIPTKYPSGGEKQLIQIITGKEVPSGAIPAQLGIVMHNVGTAYAIQEAVLQGKPLIERVVTLTGKRVGKPGNYWVRIGTTVADTLKQVSFDPDKQQKVIVGGPMMGYALAELDVPILKGTNCILSPSQVEIAPDAEEKACIRCGECAIACPALLLPQQIFWHAKAQEYDKAASFNLNDCIECGCCSYVCPSDIPLVEYYRIAKSALKNTAEEKRQAEKAKLRFETRLQRLEDEKMAREEKAKQAAAKRQANIKSGDKDAVAAAMARIAAKKAQTTTTPVSDPTSATSLPPAAKESPDAKQSAVRAAIERAKAKKVALANGSTTTNHLVTAKAKVTEHTSVSENVTVAENAINAQRNAEVTHSDAQPLDDKKAKIAAAVAKAKAKKAAQKTASVNAQAVSVETPPSVNSDVTVSAPQTTLASNIEPLSSVVPASEEMTPAALKKAKIAAAVAKAKAKKAAQKTISVNTQAVSVETPPSVNSDVTVSAPQTTLASNIEPLASVAPVSEEMTPEALKKAKIAAAVAKAKAKKADQNTISVNTQAVSVETPPSVNSDVTVSAPQTTLASNIEPLASVVPASEEMTPEALKKAKIAAAVAKAKAKKRANSAKQEEQ